MAGWGGQCLPGREAPWMVGGGHLCFRLGNLALSVARPRAPAVFQSGGTGGSYHSALGPGHRLICQQFPNGATPQPLWPRECSVTHKTASRQSPQPGFLSAMMGVDSRQK